MSKQITEKQHFVPTFYFKKFANQQNFLETLDIVNEKLLKPQAYGSVCYARFFYAEETGKGDDISQDFEEYFNSIEQSFSSIYNSLIKNILEGKELTQLQLEKTAWFMSSLWVRSPYMRKQLNSMDEQTTKEIMKRKASHPAFIDFIENKLKEDGKEISKEELEKLQTLFREKEYNLTFNNYMHLALILECKEYKNWFLAKNWRIYIAKGEYKFITSDTPVTEVFPPEKHFYGAHIMQRKHIFALTPEIVIELIDPSIPGKKIKRKWVYDREVLKINLEKVNHSDEFCYSMEKKELEALLKLASGRWKELA